MTDQKLIIRATGMLAMVFLGGCGSKPDTPPADQQPIVAVKSIVLAPTDFTPELRAIGEVVPRAGHIARLAAPVPSRLTEVKVSSGDLVSAGQVLVELDLPRFAADLASANAALSSAQAALDRAIRLKRDGIASAREVEGLTAAMALARANAVKAQRNSDLARLRSPISGVVTTMNAVLGAEVSPGEPLVEIVDPDALDIALTVTPAAAADLAVGMKARIVAGGSSSDSLGTATIRSISAAVDSSGGGVSVRARLTHPDRPLRVGETVSAQIRLPAIHDALLVPIAGLVPDADAFIAFVIDSNDVGHQRSVTIGDRTDSIAVVLRGLIPGDRVVTEGAFGMVDGAKVVSDTGSAR